MSNERGLPQPVTGVVAATLQGLTGTLTLRVSSAFWLYWLDIAVEQLEGAAAARASGLAARAGGEDVAHALLPETQGSMVATVGAAACIESFSKRVLYLESKARGEKRPPDWTTKKSAALLLRTFDVDGEALGSRLKRLFDDRNEAVHAREEDLPPEPHPLGVNSGSGHAYFTFERAKGAVFFALFILEQCCEHLRPGAEHESVLPMVEGVSKRLEKRWERVRAAEQLVQDAG